MNNEKFIIENYQKLGMKKTCEILNLSKGKIQYVVTKNNLKVDKKELTKILQKNKIKLGDSCNVNVANFTTNVNKYGAYLLGLLWSDGYISNNNSDKPKYNISVECVDEDMREFKEIFNKTGKWLFYSRKRNNWKPITKATTSNKELVEYLQTKDYTEKSYKSPTKIISELPNELRKYFLLGVIDGDGCFYFNKNHSLRQFTIAGSLNQDWTAFETIFKEIGVEYKINRRSNNKNGSSEIRVLNKINIKKLGDFIYDTINEDNIGLKRKYEKYLKIIN